MFLIGFWKFVKYLQKLSMTKNEIKNVAVSWMFSWEFSAISGNSSIMRKAILQSGSSESSLRVISFYYYTNVFFYEEEQATFYGSFLPFIEMLKLFRSPYLPYFFNKKLCCKVKKLVKLYTCDLQLY